MFPIISSAIYGVRAIPVSIETDISAGLPQFTIVGLPDASVRESRDRIRSAIKNSGLHFPRGRVTVNLAPAHLRKQGALYDLPIALSILIQSGELKLNTIEQSVLLGELGLHGEVRSVQGVLPTAVMANMLAKYLLFVPIDNAKEAAIISNIKVFGVETFKQLLAHLNGDSLLEPSLPEQQIEQQHEMCFSQIFGQSFAKRGLEIAAAGGHNVLLQGPPGTGKTLLARTFPSILPALSYEEAIEVASIASIANIPNKNNFLSFNRPFRSPHHSSSAVSLIGGGSWPAPGEVSLAHRGVLFLDELPEFQRHVLENLRQPLEDGIVTVARSAGAFTFPARFQLIATRNPCACGFMNDPKRVCVCSAREIDNYQKRLSGPLLDRIDMVIDVPNVKPKEMSESLQGETSKQILVRIICARKIQEERFCKTTIKLNNEMQSSDIKSFANISKKAKTLLDEAFSHGMISARGYFRIQKVARTIADLAQSQTVEENHLSEALQFRLSKKE
ncbi:YifB family Mg chelatase-like AAA ATPase [Candidatus Uhrbacteria bacterium]|nr:YifB family Mg chelatase-like AAA ATPase [Candidatus Uhrbacteria bacterium]